MRNQILTLSLLVLSAPYNLLCSEWVQGVTLSDVRQGPLELEFAWDSPPIPRHMGTLGSLEPSPVIITITGVPSDDLTSNTVRTSPPRLRLIGKEVHQQDLVIYGTLNPPDQGTLHREAMTVVSRDQEPRVFLFSYNSWNDYQTSSILPMFLHSKKKDGMDLQPFSISRRDGTGFRLDSIDGFPGSATISFSPLTDKSYGVAGKLPLARTPCPAFLDLNVTAHTTHETGATAFEFKARVVSLKNFECYQEALFIGSERPEKLWVLAPIDSQLTFTAISNEGVRFDPPFTVTEAGKGTKISKDAEVRVFLIDGKDKAGSFRLQISHHLGYYLTIPINIS